MMEIGILAFLMKMEFWINSKIQKNQEFKKLNNLKNLRNEVFLFSYKL